MRNILVIEDSPLALKILEHLFRQEPTLQPVFCASLAEADMRLYRAKQQRRARTLLA
jgi:CheY-like chemotaxis protein